MTKHLIFSLLAMSIIACSENNQKEADAATEMKSLKETIAIQENSLDTLKMLLEEQKMELASEKLYFGPAFDSISNPQEFIKNKLKTSTGMIPIQPVLGGTMEFRKIIILSNNWVYAMYDDGHIQGASIFTYGFGPKGQLIFKQVCADPPG